MERMTAAEYQDYLNGKVSKYHNRKTEHNGRKFDSQLEANRAANLDILIKAREVVKVMYQIPFDLAGGITYKADFVVLWADGHWTVEDSKGFKTKEYQLKKKLMREIGIEITEV